MKKLFAFFISTWLLLSCSTSSKPINYGEDGCHFCRMTIVDKQHAAQYVTKKGKHYNFDAIECMIHSLEEVVPEEIAGRYATTFLDPGHLKSIDELTFIISDAIPSPMGAFLSAFDTKTEADQTIMEKGGEIYAWDDLTVKLKRK